MICAMSSDPDSLRPGGEYTAVPTAFLAAFLGDHVSHAGPAVNTPLSHAAAAPSEGRGWFDELSVCCRERGFTTRGATLSVEEACEATRPGFTLATWDAERGWLAILEARRSKVRVADLAGVSRWTRTAKLEKSLGDDGSTERRRWVVAEAGLSGASSSRSTEALTPSRRLLEILRPERAELIAIVVYAAFIGALSLAIPIAVQQLVNTVALGGLVQPVLVVALMLLAGLAFAAGLTGFQAFLAEMLQRRVFVRACIDLANRLPRVPIEALSDRHGPELANRFFDLIQLQKTGARVLLDVSTVLLQTVAGLIVLSLYHPLMLGLSLLLVVAMVTVVVPFARRATRSAIAESKAKYGVAAWMQELLRHGRTFRSTSGREFVRQKNEALVTDWVAARQLHYRTVFSQLMAALALQVVVNSLVLALGGLLVVSGQLTLGQLVASELIVSAVVAAFARLGKQLESFYDVLAAVNKLGQLLDLPTESEGSVVPTELDRTPEIELHALGYAHAGTRLLDGLSLRIAAGERIALISEDPRRDRALLEILSGLREPDRGYVTADGRDVRDHQPGWLRDAALCLEEKEFFSGSILENLRIGRDSVRIPEIDLALERVGLLEDIRALPDGLATQLVTHGAPLSGTQLARLMVARAMIQRPRILAVDARVLGHGDSREALLDVLLEDDPPWTLLLSTSDPETAARCDRVIRLEHDNGVAVAESGASAPGADSHE